MKPANRVAVAMIALSVALPAAAQASRQDALRTARQHQEQAGDAHRMPEVVDLTERDVKGFIAAVNGLRGLGIGPDVRQATTDAGRITQALAANPRALSILEHHHFTLARFEQVAYSIGLAMATLDGEIERDADRVRIAVEQMKGTLSAEQLEAIRQQMGLADSFIDRVRNQPPGNLERVRKFRRAIDAAIEGGGS